jgi:hypothetical protein
MKSVPLSHCRPIELPFNGTDCAKSGAAGAAVVQKNGGRPIAVPFSSHCPSHRKSFVFNGSSHCPIAPCFFSRARAHAQGTRFFNGTNGTMGRMA